MITDIDCGILSYLKPCRNLFATNSLKIIKIQHPNKTLCILLPFIFHKGSNASDNQPLSFTLIPYSYENTKRKPILEQPFANG